MTFAALPVLMQNIICFCALLTCFVSIAGAALLIRQKHFGLLACSFACLAGSYTVMQICRDLTSMRSGSGASAFALAAGSLNAAVMPLLLLALTACSFALYVYSIDWQRSHVSSASIKESLDGLPAGICFYEDAGRCVLVNHRMNDIAFMLSGRDLQNGAKLFDMVGAGAVTRLSDGSAVSFRHRTLESGGGRVHELIADDITELYEKSEVLKRDAERSRRLSESMKAYGRTIDDTVRRQEILQAKIRIHDGMNRMLIAARNSLREGADEEERTEILKMWKDQADLLKGDADPQPGSNVIADLNSLAAVIGIKIVWAGQPGGSDRALVLFVQAAREAMTNAAKHGGAEHLYADVKRDGGWLRAAFTNDGRLPGGSVRESGGLADLRSAVEAAGGRMRVGVDGGFRLEIEVPCGGDRDGIQSIDS